MWCGGRDLGSTLILVDPTLIRRDPTLIPRHPTLNTHRGSITGATSGLRSPVLVPSCSRSWRLDDEPGQNSYGVARSRMELGRPGLAEEPVRAVGPDARPPPQPTQCAFEVCRTAEHLDDLMEGPVGEATPDNL
jgi:hypothetical protein